MTIERHINDQSFCCPRKKEDEHQKQHNVKEDAFPEIVGITRSSYGYVRSSFEVHVNVANGASVEPVERAIRMASLTSVCSVRPLLLGFALRFHILRSRHNRPISARFQGVWSLRASITILVSRLESRSRRRREAPSGSARRNISSTCWAASKESISPSRPARSGAEGTLGCGTRCRGFERASSNSRWRSCNATSRYCIVMPARRAASRTAHQTTLSDMGASTPRCPSVLGNK